MPAALFSGFVRVSKGWFNVELVRAKRAVNAIPVIGVRNNEEESWMDLNEVCSEQTSDIVADQRNGSAKNGHG